MNHDFVQIAYGGGGFSRVASPHSYIDVLKFIPDETLAKHMKLLELYKQKKTTGGRTQNLGDARWPAWAFATSFSVDTPSRTLYFTYILQLGIKDGLKAICVRILFLH